MFCNICLNLAQKPPTFAQKTMQMEGKLIETARIVPPLSTDTVECLWRHSTRCPLLGAKKHPQCLSNSRTFCNYVSGTSFRTYYTESICSFLLIENLRNSSTTAQEARHIGSCVVTGRGHFRYTLFVQGFSGPSISKAWHRCPRFCFVTPRRPGPPATPNSQINPIHYGSINNNTRNGQANRAHQGA